MYVFNLYYSGDTRMLNVIDYNNLCKYIYINTFEFNFIQPILPFCVTEFSRKSLKWSNKFTDVHFHLDVGGGLP